TTILASAEVYQGDGAAAPAPDATIQMSKTYVYNGETGITAAVPATAGASYVWVVENGTVTAGLGTESITITAGNAGQMKVHVLVASELKIPAQQTAVVTVVNMWTDSATGYIWQEEPGVTGDWDGAVAYCNDLVLDGHDDWRLPTIGELRTTIRGCDGTKSGGACGVKDDCLLTACYTGPCPGCNVDQGPADGCYWDSSLIKPCEQFWSSSSVEDNTVSAWIVYFRGGAVAFNLKISPALSVLCMRAP
ncbi:MAG: DUF1566 domain-containing protein, partial [Desulfobaccales bacterium]